MKANLHLMNRSGQAAAELAILGVLILTAFSFVMQFGESLGSQQQVKMESFRRALQKAYIRNASVSNTLKKTARATSVNAGFFQGQPLSPEATTSVTWQKGKPGDSGSLRQSSFAFWRINDTDVSATNDTDSAMTGSPADYGLPLNYQWTYNADGSQSDYQMLIPASVYKDNSVRTETYTYSGNKQESNSNIAYNKTANLGDSETGTIYTHFNTAVDEDPADDNSETPSYEKAAEIPYDSSIDYKYSSNWTVPHDTGSGTGSTNAGREETITTIQAWDGVYWGSTQEIQEVANQTRPQVQGCLTNSHPWVITDQSTGGGYCNTSVTTSTVAGY